MEEIRKKRMEIKVNGGRQKQIKVDQCGKKVAEKEIKVD